MAAGIVSYGAYIPIYRLSQAEIAKVWGGRARPTEKAVANCDEDGITMAVEAGVDCLGKVDRNSIDALYLATTTPPYTEKQSASLVAAALDLREDILAVDFANSLRSGTMALQAALDAVNAGSAKKVLVIASDHRVPAPNSYFESLFGDGAAAFLVGDSGVIAEVEGSYVTSSEFLSVWKNEGDKYVQAWEDRFIRESAYMPQLREAVTGLVKKYGLNLNDFSKVVLYGPDAREHTALARSLKLDVKTQVQDPLFNKVGNTGCAFVPMMLVGALEEAKPGDKILTANFSDGTDAYALKVTEGITKVEDKRGIKKHLDSKLMLPNYGKYLHFRNMMEWEVDRMHHLEGSLNVVWRDRKALIRGNGSRCKKCGHFQLPPQRVCMWCQAKDEYDYERFSDKQGELFTFSVDERAMVLDPPNVLSVVNLDGGGRYYGQMTDKDTEKVDVGMRMEFTFRKIHNEGDFVNYFWKCRPIRC
jgi:3-hydroxy-3-methylglutaryl CoA synthase